jgi:integrase
MNSGGRSSCDAAGNGFSLRLFFFARLFKTVVQDRLRVGGSPAIRQHVLKLQIVGLAAAEIPYQDERGRYADFHSLRHRFLTKAWETGDAAPTVMALAQHKDLKTTMRYTHADTSAQLTAIQKMNPASGNRE